MRGTHRPIASRTWPTGIIPAYAGNTNAKQCRKTFGRDHPRVCGEHKFFKSTISSYLGSSPRMRGTRRWDDSRQASIGIIPAYAGNTFFLTMLVELVRDHPRVCGEHLVGQAFFGLLQGSSPRMRGTLGFFENPSRQTGIIPAYAGNTGCLIAPVRRRWDHPRVCGEHPTCFSRSSKVLGSSPRMRGTHPNRTAYHVRRGIIPAYAGNTEPL